MSYVSPFTGDVIQPTDVSYRSVTLAANTQLQWPSASETIAQVSARIMDVTASAGSLQLRMPPANEVSVGQDALIRNVGANTFTVTSYDNASTIATVAAGEAKYIYITTNSTATGTWGLFDFGTGTSSADASALAGYGLLASGATLNQSHPTYAMSATYSFLTTDRAQAYVWAGGVTTATLPLAASTGNNWFVILKNNGTGTLTVGTTSAELIDGDVTKAFQPGESAFIISTGTEYITVGFGVSTQFEFGVLTKPVTGGAYTLTASEAANTIQVYTGTLSSNVTVTYPPVANFYVISNQTSAGGYTLTVTTGISGGATAQVPAPGQATLVCDGINFLNANTTQAGGTSFSLVDGSAGSPSLNFGSEINTGVFRPGAGRFGISILGTQMFEVDASGIETSGTGIFQSGVSGGTF